MIFEIWQRIRPILGAYRSTYYWIKGGYATPCPHFIKQASILRNSISGSIFIETGTYKGATSLYFRRRGFQVITIEIYKPLFDQYSPYLRRCGVDTRFGDSADLLPTLLEEHSNFESISLFLDGHYSSGNTGSGQSAVPVVREFSAIKDFAFRYPGKDIAIIVDDVRLFMPEGDPVYPLKSSLISFAESISAHWHIENDLFVCRRLRKPAD